MDGATGLLAFFPSRSRLMSTPFTSDHMFDLEVVEAGNELNA